MFKNEILVNGKYINGRVSADNQFRIKSFNQTTFNDTELTGLIVELQKVRDKIKDNSRK